MRCRLEFRHNQANDRSVAELPTFPQPFDLVIGYSPSVTDAGLAHLARQKQIRRLDLQHTTTTAAGITILKQSLPMLEVVGP